MPVEKKLWEVVEERFPMGKNSLHGPKHWRRVFKLASRIAPATGADLEVLELFALFHDSKRVNDAKDPGHGSRGAELALSLHGKSFTLSPERLDLLLTACREHTDGRVTSHATIGTCWDADRLDLWRVRIYPDPKFMSTEAAKKKEIIEWAVGLSTSP